MPPINLNDKFKGCLVGSAIGDALGYQVEFSSMADITARFGPGGVRDLVPRYNRDNNGQYEALYSDDTQMARAVAEGLIRAGRVATLDQTAAEVAEEFIAWYRSPENNRAPGNACMAGCRALDDGKPWRESGGPHTNEGRGGCGSVMRAHPYGLFYFDNIGAATATAAEHSKMTHGAPLAQAASAALAAGTLSAIRDRAPWAIAAVMERAARKYDPNTANMLLQARAMAEDHECETSDVLDMWRGWAGHEAIAAGLYIFLRYIGQGAPEDKEEAFRRVAIAAANSPGDSDSIAAIACALAGAWVGFANLPWKWVAVLERSKEIQNLAVRLRKAASSTNMLYVFGVDTKDDRRPETLQRSEA